MSIKKVLLFILPVVALILEILPFGAVCNFALDGGETVRTTFSYFDLVPFGYANFGPFITALLTIVLVALTIPLLLKQSKKMLKAVMCVSVAATVTSLFPLLLGLNYLSVTGVIISILLAFNFVLCFLRV